MSTTLFVLLASIVASTFFLAGFFAVFKPQQLVAFYMRTGGESFTRRLQEEAESEGYFRMLKVSGIIALLTGVGIIVLAFIALIR
jgi:hypothetical protein